MKEWLFALTLLVLLMAWCMSENAKVQDRNTASLGALWARVDSLEGVSRYSRIVDKPTSYWTYHQGQWTYHPLEVAKDE